MSKPQPVAKQATDEEIEEIMGELEKLKGEMSDDQSGEESHLKVVEGGAQESDLPIEDTEHKFEDFHADSGDTSLEDTLGHDGGYEDDSDGLLSGNFESDEDSQGFDHHGSAVSPATASPGALTMQLTGQMELRLKFEQEGQEVDIQFQDGFLIVRLRNGAEFKIPVQS